MIEMGLLWYEPNRGVSLAERIDAAAERYLQRFGEAPNVCLVASCELEPFDRITVRSDTRIQPGYLLLGLDRDEDLPAWRPERRSSDDAEIALLAPDGRVVLRLKPLPLRGVRRRAERRSTPRRRDTTAQTSDTATTGIAPTPPQPLGRGNGRPARPRGASRQPRA